MSIVDYRLNTPAIRRPRLAKNRSTLRACILRSAMDQTLPSRRGVALPEIFRVRRAALSREQV